MTRFNAQPGARYMHPQAPTEAEGDHARALDVAVDSSPNYLRWISDLCRPHLGASVLEVGSGVGSITERLGAAWPFCSTCIGCRSRPTSACGSWPSSVAAPVPFHDLDGGLGVERPSRLIRQQDVIRRLEHDEPGARDAGRHAAPEVSF